MSDTNIPFDVKDIDAHALQAIVSSLNTKMLSKLDHCRRTGDLTGLVDAQNTCMQIWSIIDKFAMSHKS
tara:strand:+ start:181 stop:387 length:207 start_codon:yes stop_codon:yes gene_type:complete